MKHAVEISAQNLVDKYISTYTFICIIHECVCVCVCVCVDIYIYTEDACGVMVTIKGNEHSNPSSYTGQDCLHFT